MADLLHGSQVRRFQFERRGYFAGNRQCSCGLRIRVCRERAYERRAQEEFVCERFDSLHVIF
ncbi:hypothetical protein D3C87_1916290 [compost metagenome]